MVSSNIDSSHQVGKENDDRNMDQVDRVTLLGQETAQPAVSVEETAKKRDRGQNHANREGGIPQRVGRGLPGAVAQKQNLTAEYAGESQGKQDSGRRNGHNKTNDAHGAGYGSKPIATESQDANDKEADVLWQVGQRWKIEQGPA